jgi:membrane-associated phospholipid phosphatase
MTAGPESTAETASPRSSSAARRAVAASARAVLVAVMFSAAFAIVYTVAFASSFGKHADAAIFRHVSQTDLEEVRRLGHHFGRSALNTVAVAAIMLVAATVSLIAFSRGRRGQGLAVPILILGAFAATEALKPPLGRLGHHLAPHRIASDSFPSGHATIAMSVVLATVIAVPAVLRTAALLLGVLYATLAAVLIVAVGLHPPSDVIGGYLVAGVVAALLLAGLGDRREIRGRPIGTRGRLRVLIPIVAVLACMAIALIVALALRPHLFEDLSRHKTFIVTTATFALAAAAIVLPVAWLSARRAPTAG